MRLILGLVLLSTCLLGGLPRLAAAADSAADLQQLLESVRDHARAERAEQRARVNKFLEARNQRRELLAKAQAKLEQAQRQREQLLTDFEANTAELAELKAELTEKSGDLGELFGAARQTAREVKAVLADSPLTAEHPEPLKPLTALASNEAQPTMPQLRQLWSTLFEAIVASGEVSRFQAPVVTPDGQQETRQVVRVGTFNVVSAGRYLDYDGELGKLVELPAQPPGPVRATATDLIEADSGPVPFALDPTRGQLLSLLIQRPTLPERLDQGGLIGYLIVLLTAGGLVLVIERGIRLTLAERRIHRQLAGTGEAHPANPLGRVIQHYESQREEDTETLERKLDEAILKERPALQRRLPLIKLLAAVTPLLGLLGTVTGMIQTFQDITLFGTGDPQVMADGISQALVTTALGLSAAIPLIFLHTLLSARSRHLVEILEEQAAGLIALHAEERGRPA